MVLCKFICNNIISLKILKRSFKPKAQHKYSSAGSTPPAGGSPRSALSSPPVRHKCSEKVIFMCLPSILCYKSTKKSEKVLPL